ncbi:MAG: 23S rRNA (pseudouridine(1915)-N(3))-methyltransferase RlmH [Deinococcales bacterium]
MRYRIVSIGRPKRGFYADGCRHFARRLDGLASLELIELKGTRTSNVEAAREGDSAALLEAAEGRTVAIDERGRAFDTRHLAAHIAGLELGGQSRLSLLIGGAEGHAPWLLDRADEAWSLSPLTLPHELARLVLLEQLYRAETLRVGHPYHRG